MGAPDLVTPLNKIKNSLIGQSIFNEDLPFYARMMENTPSDVNDVVVLATKHASMSVYANNPDKFPYNPLDTPFIGIGIYHGELLIGFVSVKVSAFVCKGYCVYVDLLCTHNYYEKRGIGSALLLMVKSMFACTQFRPSNYMVAQAVSTANGWQFWKKRVDVGPNAIATLFQLVALSADDEAVNFTTGVSIGGTWF